MDWNNRNFGRGWNCYLFTRRKNRQNYVMNLIVYSDISVYMAQTLTKNSVNSEKENKNKADRVVKLINKVIYKLQISPIY
ncbi:MAG: hypothetical protein ACTSYY_13950 [Promethearchaeota archaeon]